MVSTPRIIRCAMVLAFALISLPVIAADRAAWNSSRIVGSPEEPHLLKIEPAFESLLFDDPVMLGYERSLSRYHVAELGGKVWTFKDDGCDRALMVDLKQQIKSFDASRSSGLGEIYGLAFDPSFSENRYVYVCMMFRAKQGPPLGDGTRVSRFKVVNKPHPVIDVESELPIITWLAGGHNAGDLTFDRDGMLLISTGDAADPSPPDRLKTGQDISDLLGSVLRIDVRGATTETPYRIPADNPFQKLPGARPEVWAYGFRNPWRISCDLLTNQVWVGDVGWEKWELVHEIERGGNYGWSVREGFEVIQPDAAVGPTPILPPRAVLPHSESASMTGGFVYRSVAIPELKGQYIFGDWVMGKVWAMPTSSPAEFREVASHPIRLLSFGQDKDGEPLLANHQKTTTLFRLVPNRDYKKEKEQSRSFPRKLSETGLFENTAEHRVREGVEHFTIAVDQWMDGAKSEHYIALPGSSSMVAYTDPKPLPAIAMFNSRLHYPAGTVLMKTIYFGGPSSSNTHSDSASSQARADAARQSILGGRRIETQLLSFDGHLWNAYSYRWNEKGDDAELVPASGAEFDFTVRASDSTSADRTGRWRIHSRSECLQCHNQWPEVTLAFNPEQLHQPKLGDRSEWLRLTAGKWISTRDRSDKPVSAEACARNPYLRQADEKMSTLELEARAYLAVNCAHCHMFGAGGAVDLSLRFSDATSALKAVDVAPSKGSFGIADAKIIAPGHPDRSVLMYRMASSSVGRMPHIGSREIDMHGINIVRRWIESMSDSAAKSPAPERSTADAIDARSQELVSKPSTQEALALVLELLSHSNDATRGSSVGHVSRYPERAQASIRALASSSDPTVASLFEALLLPEQRTERMGAEPRLARIENLTGDVAAGEKLFFENAALQCSKCHRVGQRGAEVGPDLTKIAQKASLSQLFESIAEPNRLIEPKYQSTLLITSSGKTVVGIVQQESEDRLSIRLASGEVQEVVKEDIESRKLATTSLMPTGLISSLSPQAAADLLAYLRSLK